MLNVKLQKIESLLKMLLGNIQQVSDYNPLLENNLNPLNKNNFNVFKVYIQDVENMLVSTC